MGTVIWRDPMNHGIYLQTGLWGVAAQLEDWEGAEKGGVGLLEELAEGCCGFFQMEDRREEGEPLEVVCSCHCCEGAMEYDIMACVTVWQPTWGWGVGLVAQACCVIVGSTAEAVRVVGIEAICNGKAEDSG